MKVKPHLITGLEMAESQDIKGQQLQFSVCIVLFDIHIVRIYKTIACMDMVYIIHISKAYITLCHEKIITDPCPHYFKNFLNMSERPTAMVASPRTKTLLPRNTCSGASAALRALASLGYTKA